MDYLVPPWKHQLEGIKKATTPSPRSFAFFFEVGTGKSMTLINTLRHVYVHHKAVVRTLVITPIATIKNWEREFAAHSRVKEHVFSLSGPGKDRVKALDSKEGMIFITNYESLAMKEVVKALHRWRPSILVLDESQRIKNIKALRTKEAIALADSAQYVYLLSGTPILNSPMDIFSQFRALDGGKTFGTNFFSFRNNYFYDKNAGMPTNKYFPDWRPRQGLEEHFNKLIYEKAMRVLKHECLDLPPLVKKRMYVSLGTAQKKIYETMLKDWVAYVEDKAFVASIALTKALRLQQIVSGFCVDEDGETLVFEDNPRLGSLHDLLETLTPTHKVIVWSCFQQNYRDIESVCAALDLGYRKIIGGMSDKDRQASIDDFETTKEVRVMIANQAAGGVGINLVASDYSIYFSRNYSLEQDMQSEARNYRAGSEKHQKITRIDLVAEGTIDEVILEALSKKENVAEKILKMKDQLK